MAQLALQPTLVQEKVNDCSLLPEFTSFAGAGIDIRIESIPDRGTVIVPISKIAFAGSKNWQPDRGWTLIRVPVVTVFVKVCPAAVTVILACSAAKEPGRFTPKNMVSGMRTERTCDPGVI
ncbi:hypothetical protein HY639_06020 [Candidatus Woesearchaeota archaeon]|nr:hypothetical protein [Candidatus Woesearchaeota archaeon]